MDRMRLSIIIFCLFLLMSNFVCGNETIKETFDNMINDHINGEKINIIYGDVENYHDFFSSVVLSGNLAKYIDENYTSFPLIISEDEYDNQKNIILIGGPCANKMYDSFVNIPGYMCGDWKYDSGKSFIKVVPHEQKNIILISGTDEEDTLRAVRSLEDYKGNIALTKNDDITYKRYITVSEAFEKMLDDYNQNDDLTIIYGDDGTDSDLSNSLELAEYIYQKTNSGKFTYPNIENSKTIRDYKNQNLILIGGPCANKVSESIINNYGYNCKDWQFTNGEQLFKVVQNGDGVAIIIAGNVFNDTNQAIKKLKKYESYPEFSLNDEHIFNIKEGFDYGERCTGIRCFFTDVILRGKLEVNKGSADYIEFNELTKPENQNCYNCFLEHQSKSYIFDVIKILGRKPIKSNFEDAEKRFLLGKITDNQEMICSSIQFYEKSFNERDNSKDKLLIMENLLFLSFDCLDEGHQYFYLKRVMDLATETGSHWKKEIYEQLFRENLVDVDIKEIDIEYNLDVPRNPKKIIIGQTSFNVSIKDRVGVQVERIIRDWFSFNLERFPNDAPDFGEELGDYDINYMEGSVLRKMIDPSGASVNPITGTLIVGKSRLGQLKWYATDENGVFRFEVLPDKVQYPTTKCTKNLCLLMDTHGISSLVAESVLDNSTVVVGCGDYYDKMDAAYYLTQKGINVLYPTDRFSSEMIGYIGKGVALGSAPVRQEGNIAIVGDRPITIDIEETIVLSTTSKKYPTQYYDAPKRYFETLEQRSKINLDLVNVDIDELGTSFKIVDKANEIGAKVIGTRIAYEAEYLPIKEWLLESKEHRAILFHSYSYESGQKIFEEFPEQVSFGDPRPIFE